MSKPIPSGMWLSAGRSLLDVLRALLADGPHDVDLAVSAVRIEHVGELAKMLHAGQITRLRFLVDHGTLELRKVDRDRDHTGRILALLGAERVRSIRSHMKILRVGPRAFVTSANLNENRRDEQYEDVSAFAGDLEAFFDSVWAGIPPGFTSGADAYQGTLDAIRSRGRIMVHANRLPLKFPAARDRLCLLTNGAGAFAAVMGAVAEAGHGCSLSAVTFHLTQADVFDLADALASGKIGDLRLILPARFSKRVGNRFALAALAGLLPGRVEWARSHAKIAVATGVNGAFAVAGSANFASEGSVDLVRLRRGDVAEALARIAEIENEPSPLPPADDDVAAVVAKYRKRSAPAAGGGKASAPATAWGIPASVLAVSPDFQPFTGIAASDADLWDERDRLAMLADLHEMIRWAWPKVNPGTVFVDNWHLHELCRQYMAFVHGTCAETTLNAQPPGTGKSTIISQIGPVWGWLHYPHHRWGFASHSLAQAIKDSTFRRALIADPDFQRIFRPGSALPSWEIKAIPSPDMVATVRRSRAWRILKGKDGKALFGNTAAGYMRAASTGAKITGDHFDRLMGDDLLDGKDRAKPEGAVDWTVNVFFTRVRDGAMKWINGQRLHPRDPIGVLRDQAIEDGTLGVAGRGGVDYLCFPHHYAPDDPDRQCASSVGVTDQRTYKGELLDPRRFPESVLKAKSRDMGPLEAAAQLEQNTRLEAGMLFPTDKWGRFGVDPGGGRLEVSVDSSNWSNRKGADLTSITLSRIVDGRVYRLAHWPPPVSGDWGKADRYSVTEVVDILAQLSLDYPMIGRWLVENKAGGMGLMQLMVAGGQIGGRPWKIHSGDIVAVNPQKAGGDLKFRADTAARAQNKGLCFVLTGAEGDKFIKDCADFPNVWPDDPIASWVQQVIDPEISLLLGHRPAPVKTPRPVVKAAAIQSRRGGGFR